MNKDSLPDILSGESTHFYLDKQTQTKPQGSPYPLTTVRNTQPAGHTGDPVNPTPTLQRQTPQNSDPATASEQLQHTAISTVYHSGHRSVPLWNPD